MLKQSLTNIDAKPENELQRYKRLSGEMLNAVDYLKTIIRNNESSPDTYLNTLSAIEKNLLNDEFTIGLFGVTAAGKSTFINALLGKELMKSGLGSTSRVITELRACDKQHPAGTTIIVYKTRNELFEELKQVIQEETGELQQEPQPDGSLGPVRYVFDTRNGLETIRNLLKQHENADDMSLKTVKAFIQGWDDYFTLLDKEPESVDFHVNDQLLHNRKLGKEGVELGEGYAVYVKKRIVYEDCPFLEKGMVLLDTPGFGSDIKRHTLLAKDIVKKVDVVLILTKTDYKFAQPDREFIKGIFAWQKDLKTAAGKAGSEEYPLEIAFVMNQIGLIVPFNQEGIQEQVEQLKTKLERYKLDNVPIYATDAACALWSTVALQSQTSLSGRDADNYRFYAIDREASPKENLAFSQFEDIMNGELPKYLAKVKYTSVLGRHIRNITAITDECRQGIKRRIENYKMTAEDIKLKRDKFKRDVETCQEQLGYVYTENVPHLLKTMLEEFRQNELPPKIEAAKKHFIADCKLGKPLLGFGKPTWMIPLAAKALNEITTFIQERLVVKYCELRNNVLLDRVRTIMDRYDFANRLSIDSLEMRLEDFTLTTEEVPPVEGFWAVIFGPLFIFDSVVEKLAQHYLTCNEYNLNAFLYAVIEDYKDLFITDVKDKFDELVKCVEKDFDDAERELCVNAEQREKTEAMLSSYQQEVNDVFDNLSEIREQIKRFTAEQQQ